MAFSSRVAVAVALLATGCGSLPVSGSDSGTFARGSATAPGARAASVTEDLSFLDVAGYFKVARLFATWSLFLQRTDLDYAGCRWLDADGLVLAGTAGWTFGFYHKPEGAPPRSGYAVIHVNQKHSASAGQPGDVTHRGAGSLYLGGMPSPRQSIEAALQQGLPKGDRYAVEFLSASEAAPSTSVVTSFRGNKSQGFKAIGRQK